MILAYLLSSLIFSREKYMIDKILKDVLDTAENKWNYFFLPHRIKGVLAKLANQIQTENFFTSSYSINKFLDFLKTYVKANLNHGQLDSIDIDILREFNQVCMSLQERIINHTTGLDESQQEIIGNYLNFLRQLMENEHRNLFAKPEIKLNSTNIQSIAGMLRSNSASINADLIHQYISLLRLSFDVPELLVKYEVGLNILPLAKACFLNKNIDVHVAATQFFYVLGYQGQLLDYYKNDPRFNITEQLLNKATNNLKHQAIALQQYFFNNLNQRGEIDKPLLQHYLYVQFFKVIYKKNPTQLATLKVDSSLSYYIKVDYIELPNSLDCRDYLSADNKVIIEYKNLNAGIPEIACQAIACSSRSYEQWQNSIGLHPTTKSRYIFRVGDSYQKYSFTYAYGESPRAGGFYLSGEVKNNTVNGVAYSYFGNNHQFIDVSRHEEVHHKNFRLQLAAQKLNPHTTSFLNRNFNEGLAVLFAGGACAPDYRSQDFSNTTAPSLEILLKSEYIGYSTSWLYNNYFIQRYSDSDANIYSDLLSLNQSVFTNKWTHILTQDTDRFINWLPYLKQVCKAAPKELSIENCPSIFLKDYLPAELKNPLITTTSHRSPRKTMPQITPRTTVSVKSNIEIQTSRPAFYDDYFSLMQAIPAKNATEIDRIFHHTNYSIASIVNFKNPERGFETPLHYAFGVYGKNCSELIIQKLCSFGALPNFIDERNTTAYAMSKNCDNWPKIKNIFDNQIQNLKKSTENNETGLIAYQQKKLAISISIPLSAVVSGVIAGGWEEVTKRHSGQYPLLPSIIFYRLKPASLAMGSAAMNSLLVGSAASIGLEDAWLSFACYLGMNYLGLMLAQLGEKATKKIQNKLLNILMPIVLYTFFLNPGLLITLLSEGFGIESLQAVMMSFLSMLSSGILFKVGEYGSLKAIGKFFPVDTVDSANSSGDYFLRYPLDGTPKRISADQKTLQNVKEKLKLLTIKIKKDINNQVYKLNFEENLEAATDNISTLLEEISKEEQNIDREGYKNVFKNFEESLVNMQQNLKKLVSGKSKIQLIWEDVTTILTSLRSIRPLPQITPDLVANHAMCATIQEEQQIPLVTSFTNRTQQGKNRFSMLKTISTMFKPSEFPDPPTEQELQEMERHMINECFSPSMA